MITTCLGLYTMFKKNTSSYSDEISEPMEHYFCPQCYHPLVCLSTTCPNKDCQASLSQRAVPSFFTVSLSTQIQLMLKRMLCNHHNQIVYCMPMLIGPNVVQSLQGRRSMHNIGQANTISDACDGKLYQSLPMLQDPNNISLILNTDGAELYRSTGLSMWPLLLMINELPFSIRYIHIIITRVYA